MDPFITGMGMAVWFGILTSISPCPLATNIAAISFISKEIEKPTVTVISGLFYTLGRVLSYLVLGALLVSSAEAIPRVSFFLQQHMHIILGPLLILIGAVLLGAFNFPFSGPGISHKLQLRLARSGALGALLLGIVFALAFCPVSAALFFGSTFGIAARHGSSLLIPGLYGIGTALPVLGFAFVVAFGAHAIGALFHRIRVFEKWARRISAIVCIGAGIYILISHLS